MRHIVPISGKDSLAAATSAAARESLPYEYFFTDTEVELPETYNWMDSVEQETGWQILRIGESLPARIRAYHGFLPGVKTRYCTKECKIEPMERLLGTDACTIYYGLRADEARTGYIPLGKPNITPTYPLRDLGIDLLGVYSILDARGIAPPDFFWPALYDAVADRLASWPGWEAKFSRLERCVLFAGRSRANCSFCFFQRQYEFVWLLRVHPDLYEQAELLEKDDYSFLKDLPLRELRQPVRAD